MYLFVTTLWMGICTSTAAAEPPTSDPPPEQTYTGTFLMVGAGGRQNVPFGIANLMFNRRWELGLIGFEADAIVGLTFNGQGAGFWGSVGATANVYIFRSQTVSPHFGIGPSLSVEAMPEPAGSHIGLNLALTGGVDFRKHGFVTGLSIFSTTEIPIEGSPAYRKNPMISIGIGYLFADSYTASARSSAANTSRLHDMIGDGGTGAGTSVPGPTEGGDPTGGAQPGEREALNAGLQPKVVVSKESCELQVLEPILFDYGLASPQTTSVPTIIEIAQVMKDNPDIEVLRLEGHTDENGSSGFNMKLSQSRVDAVIALLVDLGIAPERLEGAGYGESSPIVRDATEEADHARNRRVVYRITRGMNCLESTTP